MIFSSSLKFLFEVTDTIWSGMEFSLSTTNQLSPARTVLIMLAYHWLL